MAVFTVANGGGNINAGATYVGGIAPTATDDIVFTATSGNLTVNTGFTITNFDLSTYLGTITFTSVLTVTGNLNLGAGGYTQTGAGGIDKTGTGSITSNGVIWSRRFRFNGTYTVTLNDDLNLSGNFTFQVSGAPAVTTVNGFNIYHTGTFSASNNGGAITGTTKYWYKGTGTSWNQGVLQAGINIDFYVDTVGTLTLTGSSLGGIVFGNNTELKVISGTLDTSGLSALTLAGRTIDFNGNSINNLRVTNLTQTNTLLSVVDCNTLTLYGQGNVVHTFNGFSINTNNIIQSVASSNTTGYVGGTTNINFVGTGTWQNAHNEPIRNNVTFKSTCVTTISVGIHYGAGTMIAEPGCTVNTAGTTLTINNTGGAPSLDTSTITWNNLVGTQFVVIILLSDLYCQNVTTLGFNGPLYKAYINGNLTISDYITATAPIYMAGTGTVAGSSTRYLQGALVIDTAGLISFSGFLYMFSTSSITHINGDTYVPADHTLQVATVGTITTLNCSAIKWSNFILSNSANITLVDHIYFRGNFTRSSNPTSITGTYNIYVGGNITIATSVVSTTCTFILNGSGKFNVTATLGAKVIIDTDGVYDLISSFAYGGTEFTVLKGTINTNVYAFQFLTSCLVTNIDKLKLKNVTVVGGVTLTMNRFFSGSPAIKTIIRSNNTNPYTITFTDNAPKKAYHVNISRCFITNRNQLNIINRDGNGGFNTGILFGDNGREGFPLNQFPTEESYSFADGFQTGGMIY